MPGLRSLWGEGSDVRVGGVSFTRKEKKTKGLFVVLFQSGKLV